MSRLFFVYNPSTMAKTLRLNVLWTPSHAQWSDGETARGHGQENPRITGLLGRREREAAQPRAVWAGAALERGQATSVPGTISGRALSKIRAFPMAR